MGTVTSSRVGRARPLAPTRSRLIWQAVSQGLCGLDTFLTSRGLRALVSERGRLITTLQV